ncbi:hypothetical protein GF312_01715 [Candidatus Poribacteria bacterium]|nr:hypothetical protein [Candidatus Poribacteria bacterium]
MRQITKREKVFIGIGVLAAVVILVYFFLLPALEGNNSGPGLSIDEMEARIEAMEKLQDLGPKLVDLEKQLRQESGYGDISFTRGIADSMIINFIAQLAGRSEIGELEQLDAKPYTGKRSSAKISQRNLLQATVDSMYMGQLAREMEVFKAEGLGMGGPEPEDIEAEMAENVEADFDPDKIPPEAHEFLKEKGVTAEQLMSDKELRNKMIREFSQWQMEKEQVGESSPDEPKEEKQDNNKTKSDGKKPVFLPIPVDMPDEVKATMIKWITQRDGKILPTTVINVVLDEAGIDDDVERERIRNIIKVYGDRVRQTKAEIIDSLSKLQPTRGDQVNDKTGLFTVKVIFKSRMDQLVRFLYNLQENAKWLKIESMRLSVSDRRETILAVEINMMATVLYD